MVNLSIILPVHNEASTIESFIAAVTKVMKQTAISYEILCIENGSTDRSFSIISSVATTSPHIHVYQSVKGWGSAVSFGIQRANAEYVCYMVSDGQIDPSIIPTLYQIIHREQIGMIKVKRVSRENIIRSITSRLYNGLAWFLFGLSSGDVNATPKILKTSLARKLDLQSPNISVDLELLIKLKENNIKWKEIPVASKKRGAGRSTTNVKSAVEMITYMKHYWFQKLRRKNLML